MGMKDAKVPEFKPEPPAAIEDATEETRKKSRARRMAQMKSGYQSTLLAGAQGAQGATGQRERLG
jgi:hypothetical protein